MAGLCTHRKIKTWMPATRAGMTRHGLRSLAKSAAQSRREIDLHGGGCVVLTVVSISRWVVGSSSRAPTRAAPTSFRSVGATLVVARVRRPVSSRVRPRARDPSPRRADSTSMVGICGLRSRRNARCEAGPSKFLRTVLGYQNTPDSPDLSKCFCRTGNQRPASDPLCTLHGVVFDIFCQAGPRLARSLHSPCFHRSTTRL
jgi:hypothetical protein